MGEGDASHLRGAARVPLDLGQDLSVDGDFDDASAKRELHAFGGLFVARNAELSAELKPFFQLVVGERARTGQSKALRRFPSSDIDGEAHAERTRVRCGHCARVCHCVKLCHVAQSYEALQQLARLAKPDLLSGLFPQQRAFVEDVERSKAALCTRRAGKTYLAASYLVQEALRKPGSTAAYVILTRAKAKQYIWRHLHKLRSRYQLPFELNESDLMAYCANGSTIWLTGADDNRKVERMRGEPYSLVIVDEPGSFPQPLLAYLLEEVVGPGLMDHKGTVCLVGTPAPIPAGTFFDATVRETLKTGGRWSLHKWSVRDNPFMPDVDAEIAKVLRENHWTIEHPKFRREYLGEWVRDLGSLVYPYDSAKNWVDKLPDDGEWLYTLGIDYGTVDATAFAVLAWRRRVPHEVYLVESWGRSGLIPSDAAAEVSKLCDRYRFERIVGDVGGLGKGYAEEARKRWGLPISPAQKQNKRGYIELMAGDLKAGNLRVVGSKCGEWIDEAEKLQWEDETHEAEDGRFSNHRLDAALYAYREARQWNEKPKADELTPEQRIVKAAEQQAARRKKPWYAR